MNFKRFFLILFTILTIPCQVLAVPSILKILQELDKVGRLNNDLSANIRLIQQKAAQGVKQYDLYYYRRDADDSFLMVLTAPDSKKGDGYLRTGDNFWMYLRNTRTFQHVNRDESISGTNMNAGEFEKRKWTEHFEGIKDADGKDMISEEKLGKIPVYKFSIKAKVRDVAYPHLTIWVRQDNFLVLKVDSYSLSKTLMLTNYYLKYTEVSGRYIPLKIMSVDKFELGNKTITEISGISLKPLKKTIFTKAYLENLSR